MLNKVIIVAVAAVLTCVVTYRPDWLADNSFLDEFISHEILALFAVVLTVTLASVANIHLAINRMIVQSFRQDPKAQMLASEIKTEIRDNCRIIFVSFFLALTALIVKGLIPDEPVHVAIVNGFLIWVLVLNLLTIMDVYNVVYGLSDLQGSLPNLEPPIDNIDYTDETPVSTNISDHNESKTVEPKPKKRASAKA